MHLYCHDIWFSDRISQSTAFELANPLTHSSNSCISLYDCRIGDVVDKLYKFTHKLSAAKSLEHPALGLAAYQPPYLLTWSLMFISLFFLPPIHPIPVLSSQYPFIFRFVYFVNNVPKPFSISHPGFSVYPVSA
jgi:hypothetical protein